MKRRLLTCGTLLLAAMAQRADAQLALETFNGGTLPTGWVLISDGHTVSPTAFNTNTTIIAGLNAAAWMPLEVLATGNFSMITTSNFSPAAQADRWLITPSFTVTSDKMVFKWSDFNLLSNDKLQVWVSPTAGTTAPAFTTKLWDASPGSSQSPLTTHALSLAAYNGMTIRMAFRENTPVNGNNWGFIVDDVSTAVLPNKVDGTMTSIAPLASHPTAYALASSTVSLSGVITNNGASVMNNFNINYQQGSGPIKTYAVSGANIQPLGTYSFTHSTPFSVPAVGAYPIKMWLDLTSDEVRSNDTGRTTVTGVARFPSKKLMIEEATGSWCGWCVRGALYMDSMWKTHPTEISLAAVHNSDPMTVTAYDNIIKIPGFSGYPSVIIDRREIADPSDIFSVYTAEKGYFGFADVSMGSGTYSGSNVTVPVVVKPAMDLSGDYRLVFVVTEDRVNNTSGGTWDQHNYYSGQANTGNYYLPTSSTFGDFHALAAIIPSATYYYDFVGRGGWPSIGGTTGTLPATMTSGNSYTATLTATIDPTWVRNKLRGVVLLINGTTGQILNSQNTRWSLSVDDMKAGINNVEVYPNPASVSATVRYELAEASSTSVQIIDMMGRVVTEVPASKMGAGVHTLSINTSDLTSGMYNVKITTDRGFTTERMTVVK